MKTSSFAKYVVGATVATLLAACSGSGSYPAGVAPSGKESGLTPLSAYRMAALTQVHFRAPVVHADRGKSWMIPEKKKSGYLLYVGDWSTNDVYVYSYPSVSLVGTLTGFDEPYGMCLDKKGDVFVTNFGNGTTLEYAHGGNSPISSYSTSGDAIGCSVDAKGDLAVTDFSSFSYGSGNVTVFPHGTTSGTSYSDSSCYYMWTLGYDRKGNLVGGGETASDVFAACELAAGASSMNTLTTSGITIDFPAGTQWDGKYIALGDQEAGGEYVSGNWRATLSGGTLTAVGSEIVYTDNCDSDYVDVVNPLFRDHIPKDNVGAWSSHPATAMVGPNLDCTGVGSPRVDLWNYPAGGSATNLNASGLSNPYGAVISGT